MSILVDGKRVSVMVHDRFSLNDMFIDILRPSEIPAAEMEDVLGWLDLVRRKIARGVIMPEPSLTGEGPTYPLSRSQE